ncbi:hypothetical protein DPMN_089300 [Dreissena polymorpha]|uniref:Uncharacterized protein n=1 Tax=Dreissena polymorpha TaxID=45954 RepID=A0A9D4QXB1_DREPO|nr:hypothetical protein DPMN_089300 [Dreissena polymorpha]
MLKFSNGRTDRRTDGLTDSSTALEYVSSPMNTWEDIIGTNIVTKILEDRKINVTSRVLTMKNAPPPGSHVFQPIVTIFELIQDIIETYILAKYYEDWNINVASSILELSSGNHLVDGHTDRH